jgi:hypothetical protein
VLVQPGRVAVVGGPLGILELLDLGVGNQQDHHAAAHSKNVEVVDDLSPVTESMRVTPGVAAVDLLDGIDSILAAQLVPDQAFQPIERIDDDGFVLLDPTDRYCYLLSMAG